MNLFIKKTVSVMLCLVMIAATFVAVVPESVIPASAATYRTGANGIQSSYASSRFYSQFQKIELTGDGRTDVLAIALSQLGYQESNSSSVLGGNGGGSGNYTEYNYNMGNFGVGYGGSSYAWCATFVSWALYQSRCTDQNSMSDWTRYHSGDKNYIWREVGCANWASQLRTCGYFQRSKAATGNSYVPKSGDLIFFCWSGPNGGEDHIGLVVYSDGTYVYTVEGNTSNQNGLEADGGGVYFKKYSLGYNYITGYGVLPYKSDESVAKIDYSGANPTPGYYVCNASKYVYATETSTDVAYYTQRFSMFEVVGVASNGRLKCRGITTTSGAVVEGYILNNEDRVIQITSSQPAESAAKSNLRSIINSVNSPRHYNYSTSQLNALRTAYDNAVNVLNSESSTDDNFNTAATALKNALYPYFNVISKGKSYTVNATTRTDDWADNGTELTDGVGGTVEGGSYTYSGWGDSTGAQVVIDLGSNTNHNGYRVYAASNKEWGISSVTNIEVSVSNDGTNFTKVASSHQATPLGTLGNWNAYYVTAWADSIRNERYVKISVTTEGIHTWIEEVEVGTGEQTIQNAFYIDAVNQYIYSGDCHVFTSAMGTVTVTNANHAYCNSVVAKWDSSKNAYVVKKTINGIGTDTESVTLASDEILVAAHGWEGGDVADPVIGSMANYNAVGALKVGDSFTLNGVDLNNKSVKLAAHGACSAGTSSHIHTPGAWVTLSDGSKEQRCTGCGELLATQSAPVQKPANAKTFWVTHTNDSSVEGAGVIITNSESNVVNAWAWRLIVVFKPVSGLNGVYEVSEIYDHLTVGVDDAGVIAAHASSTIPAGGFIYTLNYGNDYISLGQGDIDYTSDNCNTAVEDALTWKVGDKLQFYGIDPVAPVISTSTPGTNWYDDAYVCTSYYAPYSNTPDVPDVPSTDKLGDIDNDGDIDQYDYILAKRIHFNNYSPSSAEQARGDVNKDNRNDQYDYILIKRHHFNNYTIEGTVKY